MVLRPENKTNAMTKKEKQKTQAGLKQRIGEMLRNFLRTADSDETTEALATLRAISEMNPDELHAVAREEEEKEEKDEKEDEKDVKEAVESGQAGEADKAGEANQPPESKKCCLPFQVRRNLANSLKQIREFAERHELAMEIIEAALRILLEIAAGMAKGKVTEAMLQCALKMLNYERDKAQAHDEGVIKGRNEAIGAKYLNDTDDGLPHLTSGPAPDSAPGSIFDLARKCR